MIFENQLELKYSSAFRKIQKKIYAYDELANANAAKETKINKNISYVDEKNISIFQNVIFL